MNVYGSSAPCKIRLEGDPVYSLSYKVSGSEIFTPIDINSFRPDPREFCKPEKIFSGSCQFETINLIDGTSYENLRRIIIIVNGRERAFVRIR